MADERREGRNVRIPSLSKWRLTKTESSSSHSSEALKAGGGGGEQGGGWVGSSER